MEYGAQCPNFNSLTLVSLSAAVMSLAYSTIAFGASIDAGLHYTDRSKIDYTLNREPAFSGVFGVFNALGTVCFWVCLVLVPVHGLSERVKTRQGLRMLLRHQVVCVSAAERSVRVHAVHSV